MSIERRIAATKAMAVRRSPAFREQVKRIREPDQALDHQQANHEAIGREMEPAAGDHGCIISRRGRTQQVRCGFAIAIRKKGRRLGRPDKGRKAIAQVVRPGLAPPSHCPKVRRTVTFARRSGPPDLGFTSRGRFPDLTIGAISCRASGPLREALI